MLKRKICLLNIAAVTTSSLKESDEFVIHVPMEYDYRYTSRRYFLHFLKRSSLEEILDIMKYIYNRLHMKPLPLFSVPSPYLKAFTATQSDKKKNKFLLPPEQFRVVASASTLLSPATEDSKVCIEAFNTSQGRASLIYQRQAAAREVTLASFKIIKKLGEGNFGKAGLRLL